MKTVTVRTQTGKVQIFPVWCEVTGDQIGWQTEREADCSPAYTSFEVVDKDGRVIKPSELLKVVTF